MLEFNCNDEAELQLLAKNLAEYLPATLVMYLQGDLGAGKTSLVRGILRGLGFVAAVKSPTYNIIEFYQISSKKIYHFDLYRLQNPIELEDLGIRDYFEQQALCFFEWPERATALLPVADLTCNISFLTTGRKLKFSAESDQGEQVLKQWQLARQMDEI